MAQLVRGVFFASLGLQCIKDQCYIAMRCKWWNYCAGDGSCQSSASNCAPCAPPFFSEKNIAGVSGNQTPEACFLLGYCWCSDLSVVQMCTHSSPWNSRPVLCAKCKSKSKQGHARRLKHSFSKVLIAPFGDVCIRSISHESSVNGPILTRSIPEGWYTLGSHWHKQCFHHTCNSKPYPSPMLSAGMQKAKYHWSDLARICLIILLLLKIWVSEESLTRIQQKGVAKSMQILRLLSIPAWEA